jgi:predicted RecA/RadA family phage recombinase
MAQTPCVRKQNPGEAIDYTPVAAVLAGTVVEIGRNAFIADVYIPAGELGSLAITGVFDVPKASGAITVGDDIYWDNDGSPNSGDASSGAATTTASGNRLLGKAVAAALTGDTYVCVALSQGANAAQQLQLNVEAVVAAGSTQANGTAIAATTSVASVTAADGTKGVILPTGSAGKIVIVKNVDNAILKVYPAGSGVINTLSASAAISMAARTIAAFVAVDSTTWYTLPLLPS